MANSAPNQIKRASRYLSKQNRMSSRQGGGGRMRLWGGARQKKGSVRATTRKGASPVRTKGRRAQTKQTPGRSSDSGLAKGDQNHAPPNSRAWSLQERPSSSGGADSSELFFRVERRSKSLGSDLVGGGGVGEKIFLSSWGNAQRYQVAQKEPDHRLSTYNVARNWWGQCESEGTQEKKCGFKVEMDFKHKGDTRPATNLPTRND